MRDLISGLLGDHRSFPGFGRLIFEVTDGNPLFVEEVLRLAVARGRILDTQNGRLVQMMEAKELPKTLDEAMGLRMLTLDKSTREIVSQASVIGDAFDLSTLVALLGRNEGETLHLLDKAQAQGLVAGVADNDFSNLRFTTSSLRETAYRSTTPEERRRVHRQIGELEESRSGPHTLSKARQLAHHFSLSGEVEKARRYRELARTLRQRPSPDAPVLEGRERRPPEAGPEVNPLDTGGASAGDSAAEGSGAAILAPQLVPQAELTSEDLQMLLRAHFGHDPRATVAEATDPIAKGEEHTYRQALLRTSEKMFRDFLMEGDLASARRVVHFVKSCRELDGSGKESGGGAQDVLSLLASTNTFEILLSDLQAGPGRASQEALALLQEFGTSAESTLGVFVTETDDLRARLLAAQVLKEIAADACRGVLDLIASGDDPVVSRRVVSLLPVLSDDLISELSLAARVRNVGVFGEVIKILHGQPREVRCEVLLSLLRSSSAELVRRGIRYIGEWDLKEMKLQVLGVLTASDSPKILHSGCTVVVRWHLTDAIPRLASVLDKRKPFRFGRAYPAGVRRGAARTLTALGTMEAFDVLSNFVKDNDEEVRRICLALNSEESQEESLDIDDQAPVASWSRRTGVEDLTIEEQGAEAIRLLIVDSHRGEAKRLKRALERSTTAEIEVSQADGLEDTGADYDVIVVGSRRRTQLQPEYLEQLWSRSHTPIVVMAKDSVQGRELQARCEGVQAFIETKKWSPPLLVLTILNALSEHRLLKQLDAAQKDAIFLATHDALTGLHNRNAFRKELRKGINRATRDREHLAVVVVNLDDFRGANKVLDRPSQDKLLKMVAERLSKATRKSDSVACVGAEQFAVMLEELSKDDGGPRVVQKLRETMAQPFDAGERQIKLATRIGMAVFPGDGRDADSLMTHAEEAACLSQYNKVRYFSGAPDPAAELSIRFEERFREAVENKAFSIHYQPIRGTIGNNLAGAEALIRWTDPNGDFIPPEKFIPLAEKSGLIVPLGAWVLETACKQWQEWRKAGLVSVPLSVNISGEQIRSPEQVGRLATLIRGLELPTSLLRLEITERTILEDDEATIAALTILKSMGIGLNLDDFGTGYSSLQLLRRVPVDTIKIDRSYVQDAGTGSDTATLTAAIISMAHRLKLKVVAEGVETRRQWDFLRENDCDEFQGHLFSKALSPEKLLRLLEAERRVADRADDSKARGIVRVGRLSEA